MSGTITTSSNTPLSDAYVTIRSFDEEDPDGSYYSESDYTNSSGTYTFTGVPAGSYRLYASPDGDSPDVGTYFEATSDYDRATAVVVTAGANTTRNLKLLRGATISGAVTGLEGEAVGDVIVEVLSKYDECDSCWDSVASGYTDSAGRYSVTGLRAGTYRVLFDSNDYQREYFNNVRSLAAATGITLAAGASRTDVNARLDEGATITGTVRDTEGRTLQGINVRASGDAPDDRGHSTETDENGVYVLTALPSDRYTIYAGGDNPEFGEVSTVRTVTAPRTLGGADLTLTRRAVISGTVVDHSGTAVHDARLTIYRKVTSADGAVSYEEAGGAVGDRVDEGGAFKVYAPVGTYRISASGRSEFGDVVGATTFYPDAGDIATAEDIVVTALGQQISGKNIRLLEESKISGKVTLPAGVSGEYIPVDVEVVDPVTGETVESRTAYAEYGGTFEISGLAAGSYKVQFSRSSGASQLAAQFYNGVAEGNGLGAATTVSLSPGQSHTNVNASMTTGSALTGTVRLPNGDPAPGCRVQAFTPSGRLTTREGYTSPDGTFRIPGLSAGDYYVSVNVPRRRSERTDAWRCVGQPAPTGVAFPDPGYFTAQNGTLSTTRAGARTVTVGAAGTTSMPVALSFAATPAPPVRIVSEPTISGSARVGATLTATSGSWDPSDVTYAYQWQAGGSNVGTNQATYTPVAGDVGKSVTVTVTAARSGFASGVETSYPTSPVATNVVANTVAPSVPSAAPRVGTPIAVTNGTWNPSDVSFSYQWRAGSTDIAGATGASYTPVTGDVGKTISVKVTGSKTGYVATPVTSNSTAAVAASAVVNTVAPSVPDAAPRVGTPIAVTTGSWNPSDVSFSYQWRAGSTDIAGATGASYTPVTGDVGKTISVKVTGSKTGYSATTATSNSTGNVVSNAVVNTVAPSIPATAPRVGTPVTVSTGTWDPSDVSFAYQWKAGGSNVGANQPSYTPVAGDVGKAITVSVTGSRSGYVATTVSSNATGAVVSNIVANTVAPSLPDAAPVVGAPVTVSTGTWDPSDVSFTYQWKVGGLNVGANQASYTPVSGDVGKAITVAVTGSKTGYVSTSVTSNATAAVVQQPVIITNTATPTIGGVAKVGKVLTATGGTWAPSSVTLAYQWLRNGAAIAGATATTYSVAAGDVGRTLSVRVTASHPDAQSTLARTSAASAKVAKGTLALRGTAKITGTAKVGKTLKATPQASTPAATVKYQWYRSGKAISGASKASYKVSKSDKGKMLSVKITYSRTGYTSVTKAVALSRKIV